MTQRQSILMHTRWTVFLLIMLCPLLSPGQLSPRNLLQKKCSFNLLQQVLLSHDAFQPFPRTPADWRRILPDTISQHLIRAGEDALKETFPNVPATIALDFLRNGNRTRYEGITFGKRNRLWELVLAEAVEGKRRFTDAILNGIWSICEESFWGASAHLFLQKSGTGLPDVSDPVVDLFAAETAANLALADYFIGPELDSISPLVRRRIYDEVNRRVFEPMLTAKYDWMGGGNTTAKLNNWAPWIMSNYLTAVLLLEKDPLKRAEYTFKAIEITDQYINGFGADGGCDEGPHYWDNGPGCAFDVLNLLHSATNGRIDIYADNIMGNMAAYIYRTHISGDYFVDVADSHPQENPGPFMVWRFGKAVGDKDLGSFGTWLFQRKGFNNAINPSFHRTRSLFDLLAVKDFINDKSVFHEDNGSWLADVQLMTARLSNGLFIAAHGGNNGESHNHNDVGDFIVYYKGDPVIIDVGAGTYTAKTFSKDRYKLWFNTSAYHNLPTINGAQQLEGSIHAAADVIYKKDKHQATLTMDLQKAYPAELGLIYWKRSFAADDHKIVVADQFKATRSLSSLSQSFMTTCNVDLSRPEMMIFTTENGNKVRLQYGNGWRVTKEVMQLSTEEEQGLKVTWHNQPITRILLIRKASQQTGTFQYQITGEGH